MELSKKVFYPAESDIEWEDFMSEVIRKVKEIAQQLEKKYGFSSPSAVLDEEVHKLKLEKDFKIEVGSLFYYFYDLPRLVFDAEVFEKIVKVAQQFDKDVIIKDQTSRRDEYGLDLIFREGGEVTLYDDEFFIPRDLPFAEEIADPLLNIYTTCGSRAKESKVKPSYIG